MPEASAGHQVAASINVLRFAWPRGELTASSRHTGLPVERYSSLRLSGLSVGSTICQRTMISPAGPRSAARSSRGLRVSTTTRSSVATCSGRMRPALSTVRMANPKSPSAAARNVKLPLCGKRSLVRSRLSATFHDRPPSDVANRRTSAGCAAASADRGHRERNRERGLASDNRRRPVADWRSAKHLAENQNRNRGHAAIKPHPSPRATKGRSQRVLKTGMLAHRCLYSVYRSQGGRALKRRRLGVGNGEDSEGFQGARHGVPFTHSPIASLARFPRTVARGLRFLSSRGS